MYKIRNNVFETNSSSVHSLTMCSGDEYSKWENGETYFKYGNFYSKDAVINNMLKYSEYTKEDLENMDIKEFDNIAKEHEFYTYKKFFNEDEDGHYGWDGYEYFEETYTTNSGETVVAFGYYGEDR